MISEVLHCCREPSIASSYRFNTALGVAYAGKVDAQMTMCRRHGDGACALAHRLKTYKSFIFKIESSNLPRVSKSAPAALRLESHCDAHLGTAGKVDAQMTMCRRHVSEAACALARRLKTYK